MPSYPLYISNGSQDIYQRPGNPPSNLVAITIPHANTWNQTCDWTDNRLTTNNGLTTINNGLITENGMVQIQNKRQVQFTTPSNG